MLFLFQVDLLGDEVDTLLGLLGKIYMALDHYSPVLQHYPGVRTFLFFIFYILNSLLVHVAYPKYLGQMA